MKAPDDPRATNIDARETSVLLVSAHRFFAEAIVLRLAATPRIGDTAVATSLHTARTLLGRLRPHVVLVDHRVGSEVGLDLLRGIEHLPAPRPNFLVYSSTQDAAGAVEALRAGAAGWVSQECDLAELMAAIHAVRAGRRWLNQRVQSEVIDLLLATSTPPQPQSPLDTLSPRQREVLACLADGLTHAAAADRLFLSPNTVRTHVRDMCRALDVNSTAALVALARGYA